MSEPLKQRPRIGTTGLPDEVWMVYTAVVGEMMEAVGFYDYAQAVAYADATQGRFLKAKPLSIRDAR